MENLKEVQGKILQYFDVDQRIKELEKEKKPLNLELKTVFKEHGQKALLVGGVKAVYNVQEKTKMNEDRLVQILKDLGLTEAIILKEIPDQGKIEELIWTGKLSPAQLDASVERTYVETLTIKKASKKDLATLSHA